jgi:glycosyltransferase involved in cell wall biosynthesis
VLRGVPLICSTRGRAAADPFPRFLPTIVAQAYVGDAARRLGQRFVYLMPPVVDTEANSPDALVKDIREELGISDDASNIVLVSRLGKSVKLEGVQRAIKAVARLAERTPIRLIIVGDGSARGMLTEEAEVVNNRFGRPIVIFAGEMLDPRPVYAIADIVLGMQGSILRGMAFAKPAIVLGQWGYSDVVTPDTVDWFLKDQFYGVGDGNLSEEQLVEQIASLLSDAQLRHRLGKLGREVVCEHVSLRAAADLLEEIYETHGGDAPTKRQRVHEALRFSSDVMMRKLRGQSTGGDWRRREGGANRGLERLDVAADTGDE